MDGRVLAGAALVALVAAGAYFAPVGSRAMVPSSDFVFPLDRSYPISDREHGRKALVFVAAPSNRLKRYRVMASVFSRYPELRSWWNTTRAGARDPANPNSWRTTLYQYQASFPRVDARERSDLQAEIQALSTLAVRRAA